MLTFGSCLFCPLLAGRAARWSWWGLRSAPTSPGAGGCLTHPLSPFQPLPQSPCPNAFSLPPPLSVLHSLLVYHLALRHSLEISHPLTSPPQPSFTIVIAVYLY
uniref:Secreted protein n=1 Tax=Gopherus evgoodei TaxID=1825980 RepID=A0A8C4XYM2_9SAUR